MYCPLPRVTEDLDALRAELRQERNAERKPLRPRHPKKTTPPAPPSPSVWSGP